jgi:uncharacterized SAM-binding protein YcdF (DUF218 family)
VRAHTFGLKKLLRGILLGSGAFFLLVLIWLLAGFPLGFDRLCIRSQAPIEADYIVCVAGGLTTGELPTDEGWQRIYTSVQLYLDGWGKKIIFTGGGSNRMSEAEVYAEAAEWLGMAAGDAVLDPGPNRTSEHPRNILKLAGAGITKETALDLVTTPLHSKRTALCFAKAGYTNFRMVVSYKATGKRPASRPNSTPFLRAQKASRLPDFSPGDKIYNDLFMRMKRRSGHFFTALRELAALAAYKLKGYI